MTTSLPQVICSLAILLELALCVSIQSHHAGSSTGESPHQNTSFLFFFLFSGTMAPCAPDISLRDNSSPPAPSPNTSPVAASMAIARMSRFFYYSTQDPVGKGPYSLGSGNEKLTIIFPHFQYTSVATGHAYSYLWSLKGPMFWKNKDPTGNKIKDATLQDTRVTSLCWLLLWMKHSLKSLLQVS